MSLKIIALTRARVDRHVVLLKYKRIVGLYFNKHIRTSLFRANWVKFLHTSAYRKRYIQILCKHLWSIMAQRKSRSSSGITNTETSRPSHYEISGRLAVHVTLLTSESSWRCWLASIAAITEDDTLYLYSFRPKKKIQF